jgi:hypothetical protein
MGIQIACQNTPNIDLTIIKPGYVHTNTNINNNNNTNTNNNKTKPDSKEKKYLNNFLKDRMYTIEDSGSFTNETYLISEFAPVIFNNIRKLFGISKKDYIDSISPQGFITELMISSNTIIEELFSTSKSGSMFFYTKDGKFIIKTLPHREYVVLKNILIDYFLHLKYNKDSLLPRYFGLYQLVRVVDGEVMVKSFITMENLFSTRKDIKYRFDLKGSTSKRIVLNQSLDDLKDEKISYALKDLDLINNKVKFTLGKNKLDMLVNALNKDSLFLSNHDIIDYSLLIGIHYKSKLDKENNKENDKEGDDMCYQENNRGSLFETEKNVRNRGNVELLNYSDLFLINKMKEEEVEDMIDKENTLEKTVKNPIIDVSNNKLT